MPTIAYSTLIDAGDIPRTKPRFSLPEIQPPDMKEDWHYSGIRAPSRIPWTGIAVSAALHIFVLFSFNHHQATAKKHVKDDAEVVQMVMPEIKDLDEPAPTELQDESAKTPQVDVPTLVDMPGLVDVTMGLVQPMDMRPPTSADIGATKVSIVPVNIAHGPRSDGGGLKNIFDLSQLDRIPEATSQVAPRFPGNLKRDYSYAEVVLEFIVDSDGNVRGPTVVKSTANGFDQPAVEGVLKWHFRPGMKNGKRVNTRMRQLFKFTVTDEDN